MTPQGRRRLVRYFEDAFGLSRQRSCRLAGIHRSVVAYRPRRAKDDELRARILALARERPRFGYRHLHVLLQREGLEITHKRVLRLHRDEG